MLFMSVLMMACIVDESEVVMDEVSGLDEYLEHFEGLDGTEVNQDSEVVIESAFDWFNHPDRFEEDYEYTFTELPIGFQD